MRDAIYYGLWAAICLLPPAFGLLLEGASNPFGGLRLVGDVALPAALIACAGWALLHRGGRKPGWIGYAALAIGVVLLTHIVVLSAMLVPDIFDEQRPRGPLNVLTAIVVAIVYHGWITIPIALGATGLFVWWLRRRTPART